MAGKGGYRLSMEDVLCIDTVCFTICFCFNTDATVIQKYHTLFLPRFFLPQNALQGTMK